MSGDDYAREIAKITADGIRLRLKVARDERRIRWVMGITAIVSAAAFSWKGDYGLGLVMLLGAFYYCIVTPRTEEAGRRAGWRMAWTTAVTIVTQYPGVDRDLVHQIQLASEMSSWTEEAELAQARLLLGQIEQMLAEDDDAAK